MERPELSREELDRKLRAYFRQETAGVTPSGEWWDQALANLGAQERPARRPAWHATPLRLVRSARQAVPLRRVPPLPAMAAVAASMALVALATATVLLGGPGGGAADELRFWQSVADQSAGAPTTTPSPAAAVPASAGARDRTAVTFSAGIEESSPMVADFTATATNVTRNSVQIAVQDSAAPALDSREAFLGFALDGAAACPERETVEALRENDFAFDGTVVLPGTLSQPRVMFEVHRWLKGGDSPYVMVRMSSGIEGVEVLEQGQRWLVTGNRNDREQPRSGRCSMTRPYMEDAAREWAAAVGH